MPNSSAALPLVKPVVSLRAPSSTDVLVLLLNQPIIYQGERLVTPPSPIFYKRDALLSDVWFPIRTRAVQTKKMWNSDLHYNLIQKGAGNYEDSEESEESEVSSQGTESAPMNPAHPNDNPNH